MRLKKLATICLTVALTTFAALALTSCAEKQSPEDAIRQGVDKELGAIKKLEPAFLDQLAADPSVQMLSEFGIDGKEFTKSYLSGFDYRVEKIEVEGKTAKVTVVLTCKSLVTFQEEATKAIETLPTDLSQEDLTRKLGNAIMNTLDSLQATEHAPMTLPFELKDNAWVPAPEAEKVIVSALFAV